MTLPQLTTLQAQVAGQTTDQAKEQQQELAPLVQQAQALFQTAQGNANQGLSAINAQEQQDTQEGDQTTQTLAQALQTMQTLAQIMLQF
jgi:hypothetical protein